MEKNKLPPITDEEEKGIKLLKEMLNGFDYVDCKPTKVYTKEEIRLMDLGFKRRLNEELEDYNG